MPMVNGNASQCALSKRCDNVALSVAFVGGSMGVTGRGVAWRAVARRAVAGRAVARSAVARRVMARRTVAMAMAVALGARAGLLVQGERDQLAVSVGHGHRVRHHVVAE